MTSVQLYNDDCLDLLKVIPDNSVDMVLCDPPYGTTECKWDSIIDLSTMWADLNRIVKKNGAIVFTASQPYTSILICSNLKMWKHNWTWDKVKPSTGINAKKSPLRVVEDVCVFCDGVAKYQPQMVPKEPRKEYITDGNGAAYGFRKIKPRVHDNKGLGYPKNLLSLSNANQRDRVHPTQKPVTLMEYFIKTYSTEGETVLDFTMGSGTTGVACINTNRHFIGIEKDEKYFNIAVERINKAKELKND